MKSKSFPPIAGPDARLLILGSLPGEESLRQQQYYAKKQNAFWRIMERVFGIAASDEYASRKAQLIARRVAVWDACAAAVRKGSLDSAIEKDSIEPNDFSAFFAKHKQIKLVCFNGRKAEEVYQRLVLPQLPELGLRYESLPSTSPAHAGLNFEAKCLRWQEALKEFIK